MLEAGTDPWLVLRTRSHHENTVENVLQQKAISSFLPKRSVLRRRKDKGVTVRMPLFPGYVFVRPSMEQYEKIRYIPGSCGLVFAGCKPAVMLEKDLEAVRILVHSGATLTCNPWLIPGQPVEVIAGPFTGIQGEIVRIKSQERLVINVHLLSSSVSVEFHSNMVRVLQPEQAVVPAVRRLQPGPVRSGLGQSAQVQPTPVQTSRACP
jgi:transcription antitermination factor NusG